MAIKILISVVLLVVAVVTSTPANTGYSNAEAPASYEYQYGVKDNYSDNDFGQKETRDGATTQGSYHVNLPDGRILRVTYYVTKESGYIAEVTYEGVAKYP